MKLSEQLLHSCGAGRIENEKRRSVIDTGIVSAQHSRLYGICRALASPVQRICIVMDINSIIGGRSKRSGTGIQVHDGKSRCKFLGRRAIGLNVRIQYPLLNLAFCQIFLFSASCNGGKSQSPKSKSKLNAHIVNIISFSLSCLYSFQTSAVSFLAG